MKKILNLPSFTPNYILMLETEAEDSYLYTLGLHLKYLSRTMYHYAEHRLPRQLSFILLRRNLFWVKELESKA